MAIQQVQVESAKELSDVLSLIAHVVKEAKAKKPAAEIAAGSVAKLIDALSGVDQVAAELQQNRKAVMNTVGLSIAEIVDSLLA